MLLPLNTTVIVIANKNLSLVCNFCCGGTLDATGSVKISNTGRDFCWQLGTFAFTVDTCIQGAIRKFRSQLAITLNAPSPPALHASSVSRRGEGVRSDSNFVLLEALQLSN